MKRLLITAVVTAWFAVAVASGSAASNPAGHGQPSQTCVTTPQAAMEPGNAANARGSAFNETGPGIAGTVYAGNGQTLNTPANTNAVSQYDVACYQVTQSH